MKKILKITSLLLVVLLTLSVFASCSPKQEETPTTTESTTEESVVSTTEETSETEKEILVVSLGADVDYVPYKYKDGEKINGINIDLMNAVANKLDMNIEFIETAEVSSKKPDVFINQFNSDNFEMQNAVFSKSYMTDTQSVIVKATTD